MAVPLRVELVPDRADAQPGEAIALQVSVRNTSDVVEHYGLELLGLPQNTGARLEPDVIKLRPGETGSASVRLTLGTDPPAVAGIYTVGVLARSRYRPEISRCEELTLDVAVVQQIGLQVAPEVATGKRTAKYEVQVVNSGNVPVRLLLAATDPERRAKARFDPPMLVLPAGGAESVALAVRAPVPWNRETQRALKIEAGGGGAYGAAAATFLQRPRFASKLARIGGAVAALGIIAGAILGSALIAQAVNDPEPTPTETVVANPTQGGDAVKPPSLPPSGAQPSVSGSVPGSASGSASSAPPVAGNALKEVDLTRTGAGPVPSDAFRPDGLIVGGNPDQGGDAACVNATALAVRGADAAGRFLASSLRDKPDTCNTSPIGIRFLARASRVELVFVGPGERKIDVTFKDYSRRNVTGTTVVVDDGSHGGIEFIVISGVSTSGAEVGPALKAVKFIPLNG